MAQKVIIIHFSPAFYVLNGTLWSISMNIGLFNN